MLRVNPPTGTELKEIRESAQLSQVEFAAKLGCSLRALQGWESGAMPQYRFRRALLELIEELEVAA